MDTIDGPNERANWLQFLGKMFPTAGEDWLEEACDRLMRTFGTKPETHEMGSPEYVVRLIRLRDSVNALPPDAGNVLMNGG